MGKTQTYFHVIPDGPYWRQKMDQEMLAKEAKAHTLFGYFEEWCNDEREGAIDPTGHPDDWLIWWDCFLSGAIAQMRKEHGDSRQLGGRIIDGEAS